MAPAWILLHESTVSIKQCTLLLTKLGRLNRKIRSWLESFSIWVLETTWVVYLIFRLDATIDKRKLRGKGYVLIFEKTFKGGVHLGWPRFISSFPVLLVTFYEDTEREKKRGWNFYQCAICCGVAWPLQFQVDWMNTTVSHFLPRYFNQVRILVCFLYPYFIWIA